MNNCQPNKKEREEYLRQREAGRWEKEGDAQKGQVPWGCGLDERQRAGKEDRGQMVELVFELFLMDNGEPLKVLSEDNRFLY